VPYVSSQCDEDRKEEGRKRRFCYLCRALILCQFPLVSPARGPFPRSRRQRWRNLPVSVPIVLRLARCGGGYASAGNRAVNMLVVVPPPLCTGSIFRTRGRRGGVIEHEDLFAVLILGRVRHHVAVVPPLPAMVGERSVGAVMGVVHLLMVRVRLRRGASEGRSRHGRLLAEGPN
jgi:hypothetical protein